jgi:hypothetical protein
MCLEGPVVYGSGRHGGHARYMMVPVSTLASTSAAKTATD